MYSFQLDANWAIEKELDNETVLYLDSIHYGNIVRFLNCKFELQLVLLSIHCKIMTCQKGAS